MARSALVFTLALVVVLSGCAEKADPKVNPTTGNATVSVANEAPKDQTGKIIGTVTDDEQRPVPGAQVALLEAAIEAVAHTDESGGFALEGVPPGEHTVAAQKIGYESRSIKVTVVAGESTEVQVALIPVLDPDEAFHETLLGEGYIACGFFIGTVSVTNLNACAWDANHKPRYEFVAKRDGLKGVLQEVVWEASGPANAKKLQVSLEYKPTCDPTCSAEKTFKETSGESPVRQYIALDKQGLTEPEIPLASMTFVTGSAEEPAVAYQQPVKHYITIFYGAHGNLETFTAIPPQ